MIRDFEQKDKSDYLAMATRFFNSDAVNHQVPPVYLEKTFQQIMDQSPYLRGLALVVEEKVAGYGLLALTYSQEVNGLVVWIEELYVEQAYRSRGLGKEFFAFIEKEYKNAGRFRLEVSEKNENVIKLYEKLGYKILPYIQMVKDSPVE